MARSKIPDALAMRELKYGEKSTEADRDRVAAALRAAGRRSEAVLLYDGRPEHPAIREELAVAVAEGVGSRVLALRRSGVAVSDEQLRACAQAAEAKGRLFEAYRCWTVLGDEAGLARVRERLPHFQVAVPANKV